MRFVVQNRRNNCRTFSPLEYFGNTENQVLILTCLVSRSFTANQDVDYDISDFFVAMVHRYTFPLAKLASGDGKSHRITEQTGSSATPFGSSECPAQ